MKVQIELITVAEELQSFLENENEEFAFEHLVIMKAFASRDRDWIDIQGVLIRQHGRLDWHYIQAQLTPLVELKEEPEILQRLETLHEKYP